MKYKRDSKHLRNRKIEKELEQRKPISKEEKKIQRRQILQSMGENPKRIEELLNY